MALVAADIGECPCNILEVGHLGRSVCVRKIVSTNDHLEILASFTGLGDGAAHGVKNTRRKLGDFITRMTSMSTPPHHLGNTSHTGEERPERS